MINSRTHEYNESITYQCPKIIFCTQFIGILHHKFSTKHPIKNPQTMLGDSYNNVSNFIWSN